VRRQKDARHSTATAGVDDWSATTESSWARPRPVLTRMGRGSVPNYIRNSLPSRSGRIKYEVTPPSATETTHAARGEFGTSLP